jgi:hypothetical protein
MAQSGIEVVQDPELSQNDDPSGQQSKRLILPSSSSKTSQHGASICLPRGRPLAKGKLHRAIVGALQATLHHDDIAIGVDAI